MSFSVEEFRYELRRTILEMRPIRKGTDDWYSIRCPLCGDSQKDRNKTRFYIKMSMDMDIPFIYYCFNCSEVGILNHTILKAMELDDIDTLTGIRAMNKRANRTNKTSNFKIEKMALSIPYGDEESENVLLKKKYLENRLGISISMDKLHELKIIFNLGHLLAENNINELSCATEKALDLDENYVGFLSTNNEMVNLRQVKPSKLQRYEKYVINRNKMNYLKFYSIPSTVDLFGEETITINLTEGPLDILGVYFHVDEGGKEHSLYSASCGSDYRTVIEYFIREGIVGNVILNIYRDQDQELGIYRKMRDEYGVWFKEFNVYSNTLEKDFGVPGHQINVIKNKISK